MYTPPKFNIEDASTIHAFIDQHAFGLLLTVAGDHIHDTHTPLIRCPRSNQLIGHIARANPQWKNWGANTPAKVIFTGPHAYISPQYYASEFNVPTWNYTAVSVTGKLTILEDQDSVLQFMDALVDKYEKGTANPWHLRRDDERYMKLLAGIVVFGVSMDDVKASFKLNQNKAIQDQQSVIRALQQTGSPMDGEVASLMQANLK